MANESFDKTLKHIKSIQCGLLCQIILTGVLGVGGLFYGLIYTLTEYKDSIFGTSVKFFCAVSFLFIISLSILIWYLYKLNKQRYVLAQKYIAISTFDEIKDLLRGKEGEEPSFEYKASLKKMMETLNDLAQSSI